MAGKKAQAANGSTDTGTTGTTAGSTPTTPKKTRGPNDPETIIYWNDERKTALLVLLYSRPGQLTGPQVAQSLANHPAFVDQQALFAKGDKAVGEKIRQQVGKLAKAAAEKGAPEPQLRRTANNRGNIDSVFQNALAQVGIGQTAPVAQQGGVVSGQGAGLIGGGVPLVPVGTGNPAFGGGGLIPVPPGS